MRMGIFANRTIKKNEELTFNYNVDRYGFVFADLRACAKFLTLITCSEVTKLSLVIAVKRNVSVLSVGKRRPIWRLWTICISTVRAQ